MPLPAPLPTPSGQGSLGAMETNKTWGHAESIIPGLGSVVNNHGFLLKSPKDGVVADPFQLAELHAL